MGQASDGQPCHLPAPAGSRGTCASARDSDTALDALHAPLALLCWEAGALWVFSVARWDSWEDIV